jgi:hypothetical protein
MPVDALDVIGGAVADDPELETLLWSRLSARDAKMPHLGRYRDEAANVAYSRPLALSQLLVAYYVMDAAVQDAV